MSKYLSYGLVSSLHINTRQDVSAHHMQIIHWTVCPSDHSLVKYTSVLAKMNACRKILCFSACSIQKDM